MLCQEGSPKKSAFHAASIWEEDISDCKEDAQVSEKSDQCVRQGLMLTRTVTTQNAPSLFWTFNQKICTNILVSDLQELALL